MPVTINGDGSITGLAVGGLPDGSVDADSIAANAVTNAKISGMAASKLTGALPAISGASLTGLTGGITNIDQWYLSSQQDLTTADPLTGWTRSNNQVFFAVEGSAMTESSGVFSFPSTGMWLVSFSCWYYANARSSRWMQSRIKATTDNSSYSQVCDASNGIYNTGSNGYNSSYSQFIFDVTNTSNCKVRFAVDSQNTLQYMAGRNFTNVKFIRLTDT